MSILEYLIRSHSLHILLGIALIVLILVVLMFTIRKLKNGYYLDHESDKNFFDWLDRWLGR